MPLGQAIAEEGIAFSSSLEEEIDKFQFEEEETQVTPRISLINVPALNYLLRSQIFVNDDGQLRATHLILDYEPLSRSFLDVSNAIRANNYRLARIDMSRPHFLAPHDLPPVDHPIL